MNGEKPPEKTNNVFSMPEGEEYNRRKIKPPNPNETRKQEALTEELFDEAIELAKREDYKGALKIYEEIVRINPNNIESLLNIGISYLESGDLEKAEEFLGKALQIDPGHPVANFDMGSLKGEQGQREEEIKYYLKVIEINPLYADAYYNLGVAWKVLGKYENAIQCYRKYLDLTRNKKDEKDEIERALLGGEIERCEDLLRKEKGTK